MRRIAIVLVITYLAACDGPAPIDGGVDAGALVDLRFTAEPDPEERTDCPAGPPLAGETRAKHVACASELARGSLALGRVGDIVLENARARFVVRTGDEAGSTIGAPAGGVVDAAPQGGVDLLKELFPLFDLVSIRPSAIVVIDAGASGESRVRVLFEDAPIGLVETVVPGLARGVRLRGQLDYVLAPDDDALRLEMTLTTEEEVGRSSAGAGLLALLGGQELFQPGYGVLDDDHLGAAGEPVVVGERADGAIAVAMEGGAQEGTSLTHIETIHIVRGPRVTLTRGALTRVFARLAVSAGAADALSAVRSSDAPALLVEGAIGDRVELTDASGAFVLRSRLDADGRARLPLPPGRYTARAGFRGYFTGAPVEHDHPGAALALAPAPSVELVVAAQAGGASDVPVRVTIESGGVELERFVALGETSRRLPPGDHRVTISHGLEHDVATQDVSLAPGAVVRLEPDLARVLDTSGWASIDLHLHSELSTDSVHPAEDAARLLAAEGVEAAAATDHDFITDYGAVAARAGVGAHLVVVPGVEVSTTVFGHINGYPLVRDPDRAGMGAPVWFDRSPAELFAALRARGDASLGGALVQINHPRLRDAAFFGAVGLDLESGRATADPSSLGLPAETDLDDFGFDVVEVWNGYTRGGNESAFEDYLALFAADRRFTMVGNSDSHVPERPPGSPRSFVAVADDTAFGWTDLAAGLRAGRVTVAAGLFVTAELAGPRAGDVVPVRVLVQAPPWARADRLRVYAGRDVVLERTIDARAERVRLDEVLDVPLGGARFVVVRADGDVAPEPMQHFPPMGVTNPLLVP